MKSLCGTATSVLGRLVGTLVPLFQADCDGPAKFGGHGREGMQPWHTVVVVVEAHVW